jgi:hypothetical protein
MKKIFLLPVICLLAIFFLNSCLKDKVTKTYTIYTPVYKTKAEVLANIKTNGSQTIQNAGKFFLYDHYLFVNEIDKGIHIIDNSNPANPKNVGFIDIPGNVDLAIKNNILYADLYSDLVTIDVTNPLQARLKKVVKNAFPHRKYVNNPGFTSDTGRIIVSWLKKDTVVEYKPQVVTPQWNCWNCSVMMLGSMDSYATKAAPAAIAGSMARFAVVNANLYTIDNTDINVFSVQVPEEPVFKKKVQISWGGIETMFPFKDKLFIGSQLGMFIYDISDPNTPTKMGQFSHARVCDPVIADDDYAFVTLRSGVNCAGASVNINQLDVINIRSLSAPYLIKSYTLTNPRGLSKDGNLLFICDGNDGLKVFNAADVNNLKLVKQFKGFESFDVIAYNNIAMVVEKSGIRQFDYSNPADIRYLSTISW